MSHRNLSMSFLLCLILATSSLNRWTTATASPEVLQVEEEAEAAKGEKRVLRNAFDEIARSRRQVEGHEQVVRFRFRLKSNRNINSFTQEEKDYLLLVHNAYRSAVQPFASNMQEVVWDDRIAAMAQDWANQCTASHRENRNLGKWRNMGENIFWSYSGGYHEGMGPKFWWDEVQWYNISTMHCVPGKMCGHYITMNWAETNRIGCGVNRCRQGLRNLPHIRGEAYYFVCNYNARFISHMRPYKVHRTICSQCYRTRARKCRYNLCVTPEMLRTGRGYNGSTAEIGFDRVKTHTSMQRGNGSKDRRRGW